MKDTTYIFEFDGDFSEFLGEPVLGLLEVGGPGLSLGQEVFQFLDPHAQLASEK